MKIAAPALLTQLRFQLNVILQHSIDSSSPGARILSCFDLPYYSSLCYRQYGRTLTVSFLRVAQKFSGTVSKWKHTTKGLPLEASLYDKLLQKDF